MTSDLQLDNPTHPTIEKTPNSSKISIEKNLQITQDDNDADIYQTLRHIKLHLKGQLLNLHVRQQLPPLC